MPPKRRNKKNSARQQQLADWIIVQFIKTLKQKNVHVRIVPDLKDSKNPKKRLLGLLVYNAPYCGRIYLEMHMNWNDKLLTLIHELGHMTWICAKETQILNFHSLMVNNSSRKMQLKLLEILKKKIKIGRQPK